MMMFLQLYNINTGKQQERHSDLIFALTGWSRIAIKCQSCPWGIPGTKDVPGTSLTPDLLWDCLKGLGVS